MKGPRRPVAITLLLALAMVGVFGVAIAGCSGPSDGASASSAKSTASQAQKDNLKTLNVGSDLYPPFVYADEYGETVGLDVEILTEALARIGYKPKYQLIDWEKKKDMLASGELDCVMGSFTMTGGNIIGCTAVGYDNNNEDSSAYGGGVFVNVVGQFADDITAGHGQLTLVFNTHTAAESIIAHYRSRATVDNAAVYCFCAACAPLPQTVGVGGKFVCRCGVAVLYCQMSAAFYPDNAAFSGYFKHIAVNIQCNVAVNDQGSADFNVAFQRDYVHAAV